MAISSHEANKDGTLSRTAKLAALMDSKHYKDRAGIDPAIFQLVARFCIAEELDFSPETAIPLACAASQLDVPDLLQQAISFITTSVLPFWNETVQALHSTAPIFPKAHHLGLVNACLSSISDKALADPTLLEDPNCDSTNTEDGKAGVKRRLFSVDSFAEDLTKLPLHVYAPALSEIIRSGVPSKPIAHSLYRFTKRWVDIGGDQREMIEAVERMLPKKKGALHVRCLFEMLRAAIHLQASYKCRDGLEARIGPQLPEASVNDLYIPCSGYSNETKFDVKCLVKMLGQSCRSWSPKELEVVTGLVEVFLAETAGDENLSKDMFVGVVDVLVAMGEESRRSHDGIYRAIDVYLKAHRHLTEAEREELCKVLNCYRLSGRACEHAAQNERMPMRMVAQVLFIGQIRIREKIAVGGSSGRMSEEEQEKRMVVGGGGDDEEDMMKITRRVKELEIESVNMRREIELECGRKGGKGIWMGMKDLLGCKGGANEFNCPGMRKKNKRQKLQPKNGGGLD